jgi:small subunit ribosomal protein S6
MRVYESTFILSPQADDVAFDRQIKSVSDLISRYRGKLLQEDRWGIRRLAYPIQKFTQGYYTRVVFEGNNEVLTELERFYRLEEPFIRHLTVIFEGKLEGKDRHTAPKEFPKTEPFKEAPPAADKTPVEEKPVVEPVEEKSSDFSEEEKPADTHTPVEDIPDVEPVSDSEKQATDDNPEDKEM